MISFQVANTFFRLTSSAFFEAQRARKDLPATVDFALILKINTSILRLF